jgi:hypothetical protein
LTWQVQALRPGCATGYYGYPRNALPTEAGHSASFKRHHLRHTSMARPESLKWLRCTSDFESCVSLIVRRSRYCEAHPFDCTFSGYGSDAAGNEQRALNDQLRWLFEASSAVFPSIYLGILPSSPLHSVANNTEYIRQTVTEAIRLSSTSPGKVAPVTWTMYDNYPRTPQLHNLSSQDLHTELLVPLQSGARTLLLWGATSSQKGQTTADLQRYVQAELSPVVRKVCSRYGCAH